MNDFNESIKKITDEMIMGSEFENIIREQFKKGFEKAVNDAFAWGPVKKAIQERIEAVMVPYIEEYDMSQYIIKLDSILEDIVEHTALQENKEILKNFRDLMIEPDVKSVTLEDIMEEYKKHVARNMNTTGREVNMDDEPSYVPMELYAEIVPDEERSWSRLEYATLELGTEEEDQQYSLNFSVKLSRWSFEKEKGYELQIAVAPSVKGMRYISEFEVYLLRLARAGVRILDTEMRVEDDVEPIDTPEATFE